jgi:hypothetical protein
VTDRDRALWRWLRANAGLALRTTAVSIGVAGGVGVLLMLAHTLLQPGGHLASTPVIGTLGDGVLLPVLLLALGAWVLLSQFGHRAVTRQVRRHLVQSTADARIERALLDTVIVFLNAVGRGLGVSALLMWFSPRWAIPGLVLVWVVVAVVARHRLAMGQAANDRFVEVQRLRPTDEQSRLAIVESMYERETMVNRLSLPQATALIVAMLLGFVVPIWVLSDGTLPVAEVLLLIIWIQAVLSVAASAGMLGFQSAAWYRRQPEAEGADPITATPDVDGSLDGASEPEPARMRSPWLALCTDVPDVWPTTEASWLRIAPDGPTLLLLPGPEWGFAGLPVILVARHLATVPADLIVLRHLPWTPAQEGYDGLGATRADVAARLATMIDPSTTVVVCMERTREAAEDLARRLPGLRLATAGDTELADAYAAGTWERTLTNWLGSRTHARLP